MGHICRTNDTRPVKALLFGKLEGSRKVGRPLLRDKDTCKMALQRGKVLNEWNAVVNDCDKWKALIQNVCKVHNQKRKADYEERRQKRLKCYLLLFIHTCNYDLYPYPITKGDIISLDSEDGLRTGCQNISHKKTVLLRIPINQMIVFNQGMLLLGSLNHFLITLLLVMVSS